MLRSPVLRLPADRCGWNHRLLAALTVTSPEYWQKARYTMTKLTTEEARAATENAPARHALLFGLLLAVVSLGGALWFYAA